MKELESVREVQLIQLSNKKTIFAVLMHIGQTGKNEKTMQVQEIF